MRNAITELGYLGLEVSNLGQWDKFAAEVLGMGVSQGPTAASRWLRIDEQRNRIILTEGPMCPAHVEIFSAVMPATN